MVRCVSYVSRTTGACVIAVFHLCRWAAGRGGLCLSHLSLKEALGEDKARGFGNEAYKGDGEADRDELHLTHLEDCQRAGCCGYKQ